VVTLASFRRAVATYAGHALEKPGSVGPITLVRDFPTWVRSQQGSALDAGDPWVTFGARRALERILTPSSQVFEFGTGGSTIFFAQRARQVVAVEHDPGWFELVEAAVRPYANVELILVEPAPMSPEVATLDVRHYTSTDERYRGQWFRDYVRTIERFPDGHFDVVLVDGRCRVESFVHGSRKVRPGGWIVLDDSERAEYAEALRVVAGWKRNRFGGPKPYVPQFVETTLWQRPS
jgi:hypothetical protein